MNPDEVFALLVVIVIVAGIIVMRRQASGGRRVEAELLREEMQELRERIHVLERVITDTNPTADLDRRIERLRD